MGARTHIAAGAAVAGVRRQRLLASVGIGAVAIAVQVGARTDRAAAGRAGCRGIGPAAGGTASAAVGSRFHGGLATVVDVAVATGKARRTSGYAGSRSTRR